MYELYNRTVFQPGVVGGIHCHCTVQEYVRTHCWEKLNANFTITLSSVFLGGLSGA